MKRFPESIRTTAFGLPPHVPPHIFEYLDLQRSDQLACVIVYFTIASLQFWCGGLGDKTHAKG
jgi:hypothetical protein